MKRNKRYIVYPMGAFCWEETLETVELLKHEGANPEIVKHNGYWNVEADTKSGGKDKMRKKIIFWKDKLSGTEGHGRPLEAPLADAWVKYGNDTYPHIIHMTVDADITKIREPGGGCV